jgi:eukaryotic-like serine/threonine-protein kinase
VISAVVACAVASIVLLTLRASPRVTTPPERAIAVVPDATIASIAAHDEAVADVDAGPATTGDAVPSLAASHVEKPGTGEAAATDGRPIDAPAPISRRDGMQVPEPRSSGVLESRTRKAGSPANGELKVVVLPWAEVWLDGKRLGQAPILGLKVPPGRYTLRLKNDAAERTLSVTVTSSRLTVVDMTL